MLSENVAPCIQRWGLAPALLLGSSSVVYWHLSDDLRLYIWVQLAPLLAIPALIALFPARYSHRAWLLVGLVCYGAAKLAEFADAAVFELSAGLLGGHTLKHLLAGAAIATNQRDAAAQALPFFAYRRNHVSTRRSGNQPFWIPDRAEVTEVSPDFTSVVPRKRETTNRERFFVTPKDFSRPGTDPSRLQACARRLSVAAESSSPASSITTRYRERACPGVTSPSLTSRCTARGSRDAGGP